MSPAGLGRARAPWTLAALLAASLSAAAPTPAQPAAEPLGSVLELPRPPSPHWIVVGDFVLRRAALLDLDSGRFLGQLSSGVGVIAPLVSAQRGEIYLPETYYSRGSRGGRSDLVTVYDGATLAPLAEVAIPPERADVVHGVAQAALLDDGRTLAVLNFTPANSVTIVDVAARRFIGKIATPGCSLVYAAGPHRFAMLCGDGTLLLVTLDDAGREVARARSEKWFDPIADPVTEKAVRAGATWLFVSFEGVVHPVDLGGETARFGETWSLLSEGELAARWRIGGVQHLAVHEGSGRLYSLMHQGGPDGHKDPGTEIWVYDLNARARVQAIEVHNLVGSFAAQMMGLPADGAAAWLLERVVPNPGADSIAVTRDAEPRLLAVSRSAGTVGVYDARTGAFLRNLEQVGFAPGVLLAPW
jgi:methylamine dehydrogenase heavy chain